MAVQINIQNPYILSVNAAHERIPNHMVRPPALDLDDGMNMNQMSWSTHLLYDWNVNGSSSQQFDQMIDRMYIAYRAYVANGKDEVAACKMIVYGFTGALQNSGLEL